MDKTNNEETENLTQVSRKGGWFYTEEGMERLRKGGAKGRLLADKSLEEKLGNRHRMYMPLTRDAARAMKSVKGFIRKFRFLNDAISAEIRKTTKGGK